MQHLTDFHILAIEKSLIYHEQQLQLALEYSDHTLAKKLERIIQDLKGALAEYVLLGDE